MKTLKDSYGKHKKILDLFSSVKRGLHYYLTRNSYRPKNVHIELTRKCNSHCIMCSVIGKENYELSIQEIRNILSDPLFDNIMGATLSGGEAILRKDLIEVIKTILAVQPKIQYIGILTNGFAPLLLEKTMRTVIALCHEHGSVQPAVVITLLGASNETYQRLTSVSSGFTLAMDSVHRMLKLRDDYSLEFRLNSVIQRMNINEVPRIYKLSRRVNVPIRFSPIHSAPMDDPFFEKPENKEKLFLNKRHIDFLKCFFAKPRTGIDRFNRAYWNGYFKVIEGKRRKIPCTLPYDSFVIESDGRVTSCIVPFKYGNVRDIQASRLWNAKDTKLLRKRILKEYCPRCPAPCGAETSIREEYFYYLRFLLKDIFTGKYRRYRSSYAFSK